MDNSKYSYKANYTVNNKNLSTMNNNQTLIDIPNLIKLNLKTQVDLLKKSNNYDYDQVIKNFRKEERILKDKKKKLLPLRKKNLHWRDTAERYKTHREEDYIKRREQLEMKMLEREDKLKYRKDYKISEKGEEAVMKHLKVEDHNKKLKENLNNYKIKTEQERLNTEKIVDERLSKRAERQVLKLKEKQSLFENKRLISEKRHDECRSELDKERNQKLKDFKLSKIDQFENWFYTMKALKQKYLKSSMKNKHNKENSKFTLIANEELKEKQRIEIEENLRSADERREKVLEEKNKKFKKECEKRQKNLQKTKINKANIDKFIDMNNKLILEGQTKMIINALDLQYRSDLNKSNIQ